jgi:hypothetical protein
LVENLLIVETPLQYLLARLIIREYCGSGSAILRYYDRNTYGDAFEIVDKTLGPREFELVEEPTKLPKNLRRVGRLFICNRYTPTQIIYSYRIRHDHLCGFEDGMAFYMGRHPHHRWMHDRNRAAGIKNYIRLIITMTGASKEFKPFFFPFSRFDETYSVFPWVAPGVKAVARNYSIRQALGALSDASERAGAGVGLLLSQALTVDRVASAPDYTEFLVEIIQTLKKRHRTVLFKPHPRDPSALVTELVSRGGMELLPTEYQWAPVELYIATHSGTELYGFTSSPLIYASVFGAKAWSLAEEFKRAVEPTEEYIAMLESAVPLLERAGVKMYER